MNINSQSKRMFFEGSLFYFIYSKVFDPHIHYKKLESLVLSGWLISKYINMRKISGDNTWFLSVLSSNVPPCGQNPKKRLTTLADTCGYEREIVWRVSDHMIHIDKSTCHLWHLGSTLNLLTNTKLKSPWCVFLISFYLRQWPELLWVGSWDTQIPIWR